jgi:hypothetical protein
MQNSYSEEVIVSKAQGRDNDANKKIKKRFES